MILVNPSGTFPSLDWEEAMPWSTYTIAYDPPPTGQVAGERAAHSSAVSSSSNKDVVLRIGRGGSRHDTPVVAPN